MTLSSVGEFGFIDRLSAMVSRGAGEDLVVGIGDDAAVWRIGDEYLIATTDTMVEGVHFLPGQADWRDIGWKAMAVNISDIAAMGGWPRMALVTLALPPDTPLQAIDDLYDGLWMSARTSATTIAGGDTVRASEVSITVAVLGRPERDAEGPLLLRRNAAREGDAIAVTGPLGDSAAGLRRLREDPHASDSLTLAHLRPNARLAAGVGAVQNGVRCGMDISDGLLQDLGHICTASGVGATIEASAIPISDDLRAGYPEDALELACTGGEDYELLLAGPRHLLEQTLSELDIEDGAIIGTIVKDYHRRARVYGDDGKEIRFRQTGWDAFRP